MAPFDAAGFVGMAPGAAGQALPAPVECCALGDSLVQNATSVTFERDDTRGWFFWASNMLGGALRFRANSIRGVAGETTSQILARVSQVTGLSPAARLCFLTAGTNDVTTGVPTATAIANYAAIVDALNAAGLHVIAINLWPANSATAGQIAAVNEINEAIRGMQATKSLSFADAFARMIDPATGLCRTGVLMDNVHLTAYGARLLGEVCVPHVARLVRPQDFRAQSVDPGNLALNGLLTGTGGNVVSAGFLGVNADGWSGFRNVVPTGGTITLSKVARYDSVGEWVQIALASVTSSAGGQFGIERNHGTWASLGLAQGDTIEAFFETEIDPGTQIIAAGGWLRAFDGAAFTARQFATLQYETVQNDQRLTSDRYVVRLGPVTLPAAAGTTQLVTRLFVMTGSNFAAATGTARFGRVAIRKL